MFCSLFIYMTDRWVLGFDLGTVLFLQKAGPFHGNKQISVHHLRHQGVDRKSCWHWISSLAHTRHKKQLCYYFNVIHEKSEIWRIPYLEHVYVWREQLKFCSVANKHSNLDVFGVLRRCHLKTHLWFQSDIPFASWKSRKNRNNQVSDLEVWRHLPPCRLPIWSSLMELLRVPLLQHLSCIQRFFEKCRGLLGFLSVFFFCGSRMTRSMKPAWRFL